jgi:hypothetical protein
MTTIDPTMLATVTGGVWSGSSREQMRERYQNVCLTKDARAQYDTMLKQMTPDDSEAPGFKRRTVKSISQLCDWPFPG